MTRSKYSCIFGGNLTSVASVSVPALKVDKLRSPSDKVAGFTPTPNGVFSIGETKVFDEPEKGFFAGFRKSSAPGLRAILLSLSEGATNSTSAICNFSGDEADTPKSESITIEVSDVLNVGLISAALKIFSNSELKVNGSLFFEGATNPTFLISTLSRDEADELDAESMKNAELDKLNEKLSAALRMF